MVDPEIICLKDVTSVYFLHILNSGVTGPKFATFMHNVGPSLIITDKLLIIRIKILNSVSECQSYK